MNYTQKIKTLLSSDDDYTLQSGMMLLESLDEPSLADILKPLSYIEETLYPPVIFRRHVSTYIQLLARYAKHDTEIASFCASITKLSLPKMGCNLDLQAFSNVTKLIIYQVEEGLDLSVLAELSLLTDLEMCRVGSGVDILFVSSLKKLQSLTITSWPTLECIDGLADHPTLRTLRIVACPKISATTVLERIPNLEHVQVFGSPNVVVPSR